MVYTAHQIGKEESEQQLLQGLEYESKKWPVAGSGV